MINAKLDHVQSLYEIVNLPRSKWRFKYENL